MNQQVKAAEAVLRRFADAYLVRRDAGLALACLWEDAFRAGAGIGGIVSGQEEFRKLIEKEIQDDPLPYEITWEKLEAHPYGAQCVDIYADLVLTRREGKGGPLWMRLLVTSTLVERGGGFRVACMHASAEYEEHESEYFLDQAATHMVREMRSSMKAEALRLFTGSVEGGMIGFYTEPGHPLYFINGQMLDYLGYTLQEFEVLTGGMLSNCVASPENAAVVERDINQDLREKGQYEARYQIRKKDGSFLQVLERGKYVKIGDRDAAIAVCVDCTKTEILRQELEEKAKQLAEQQEELAKLGEKVSVGVQKCKANAACEFLYMSDGFLKMTGYTREEITSIFHNSFYEMLLDEDRERVCQEVEGQLQQGSQLVLEYRIRRKDGTILWVLDRGDKAVEKGEDVLYCVVMDVTGIHDIRWFYKNVLDSLPTALIVTDREKRLTLLSKSAERLLGIRAEDCLGKPCSEWNSPFCQNRSCAKCSVKQEQPHEYFTAFAKRWRTDHTRLLDAQGELSGYVTAINDITELETLNSTLQLLNDNIPGGICEVALDDDFTLIYGNDAFYSIMGYTPEQLSAERNNCLGSLTHPDDSTRFRDAIREAYHSGDNFEYEKRVIRRDGAVAWILVRGAFIINNDEPLLSCVVIDTTERRAMLEELQINEERLRIAMSQTTNIIFDYNILGHCITHPDKSVERYGLPALIERVPDSLVEQNTIHPEDVGQFTEMYRKIDGGEASASCEVRVRTAGTGGYIWNRISLNTLYNQAGAPVRAVGVVEDTTARKEAENRYLQEEQYRNAMLSEALMVYEVNATANRFVCETEGLLEAVEVAPADSYAKFVEATSGHVVFPEDRRDYMSTFSLENIKGAYARGEHELKMEYRLKMEDGVYRWVTKNMHLLEDPSSGDLKGFTYVKNIDEQKREEIALKFRSERDALTGLYNKGYTEKTVRDVLAELDMERYHALMIVDIDSFKNINDTYGHMLGDQVLRECSRRIKYLFRSGDIIGRVGGDEFFICVRNISGNTLAEEKAFDICQSLRESFRFGDVAIDLSCSLGAALYPQDGDGFDELYRKADLALYEAKRRGKNGYCFYDDSLTGEGWTPREDNWKTDGEDEPPKAEPKEKPAAPAPAPDLAARRRWRPLTAVAGIVLLASLGIAALCAGYLLYFNDMIRKENRDYLQEVSNQITLSVERAVSVNTTLLSSMAAELSKHPPKTLEEALEQLADERQLWGYNHMALIDREGNWHCSDADGRIPPLQKSETELALYGHSATAFLHSEVDGTPLLIFTVPFGQVIDGTEFKSIVVCYDLDQVDTLFSMDSFDGTGYAYLLHSDGSVLLRSGSDLPVKPGEQLFTALGKANLFSGYTLRQMRVDLMLGKSGFMEYEDAGVDKYMLYTPVKVDDWYLATVVPAAAIGDNTQALFRSTVVVSVLITALFTIVLLLFLVLQLHNRRRLERIAFVDPVTGGHNKRRFEQLASGLLEERKNAYVLVYSNIDRFKLLNDRFGRSQGDNVLRQTGKIIADSLQRHEVSGRLMADNFGILMCYSSMEALEGRLFDINRRIQDLIEGQNARFSITMSYGIYFPDTSGEDINAMLDKANLARRGVAAHAKLPYAVYDERIKRHMLREKELEDKMHIALLKHEFVVYLQPKYNLSGNVIGGAEALVRWNDPEDGLIGPNDFIPLFERNGFVVQIDQYVFEQVCRLLRRWLDNGIKPVPVSVNLSRANLEVPNFLELYRKILYRYDIPSQYIEFEFTETLVYENVQVLSKLIDEIHEMGCTCSMDDFGSGYSSLNLLKNIHVDVLKIDRAFFDADDTQKRRGMNVVKGVVSLARSLDLKTVSEGVETMAQAEFLREIGCDMIQGYVFSKPLPPEDFEELCFGGPVGADS